MKRFYKLVTRQAVPGGFAIHLDGKQVKTPSGATLKAPTEKLADALVREWAAQGKEIKPDSMPLTQILTTALDRVAQERVAMEEAALAYLDTDLLCYRAPDAEPIAAHQAALWDPWLGWFAKKYGVTLATTAGLAALAQPEAAHEAARAAVEKLDGLRFTAFRLVVSLSGSLVLALAFTDGAAAPEQVFAAAHAEDTYKAALYNEALHGPAPHEETRRRAVMQELEAAGEFLDLLRT